MARKYDLISELYNRTCKTVVSNPQNWQAFLASACRNYKLRYDEQLLVYAQRPDATAVLEIEQWNKIFGRWVNRGARGIAVFADENRSRQRLTHYFDISDTHESRYSRTVPIWDMRQEYEADVIETLESTFGEIENKSSLAEAIMGAARNAAEDNIPDYLQDLYYATEGSSFEEVEEDIVAFIYKNVVTNSVAYMMMSRLGVDTDGDFKIADNNLLKAHFLNVALKHNMETRKFRPVKIEQRARIDGFVSVIDAMTVRQKYYGETGEMLKNAGIYPFNISKYPSGTNSDCVPCSFVFGRLNIVSKIPTLSPRVL